MSLITLRGAKNGVRPVVLSQSSRMFQPGALQTQIVANLPVAGMWHWKATVSVSGPVAVADNLNLRLRKATVEVTKLPFHPNKVTELFGTFVGALNDQIDVQAIGAATAGTYYACTVQLTFLG